MLPPFHHPQVLTMVDNIKETQVELKERRSSVDWVRTHRKQESKDSTSSADTQQSDLSHTERLAIELMHSTKTSLGDISSPSAEKSSSKSHPATKPLPLQSPSPEKKRPDALSVAAGFKKPSTHLRFAKDPKKTAAPKSEHTPGQVCVCVYIARTCCHCQPFHLFLPLSIYVSDEDVELNVFFVLKVQALE